MEYHDLYNRYKDIVKEITLQEINNEDILKKLEILKKSMYSKNPLVRLSINNKLEELERILNLNNDFTKKLKK